MNDTQHSPYIIDVHNLSKSFNSINAVVDLNLQILPGTIFGLLGPNGCGKTTALRMLCGLIIPDHGQGTCLGFDLLTEPKLIQAQIGYMPQKNCLYRNLTVYENLDFISRIYGLKNRKENLQQIMNLFSFEDKQHQLTHTLSIGWQQRVALAAALLHKPRILFLDEPTSGIDPQSRLDVWEYLQLLSKQGVTILASTHYMDEAERCHQLIYMISGKTFFIGSTYEIIQSSGLHTWRITGKNLPQLVEYLHKLPGIIQVIEKGNEIRISAMHRDVLDQLEQSYLQNYDVREIETTLDDVFIFNLKHNAGMRAASAQPTNTNSGTNSRKDPV